MRGMVCEGCFNLARPSGTCKELPVPQTGFHYIEVSVVGKK